MMATVVLVTVVLAEKMLAPPSYVTPMEPAMYEAGKLTVTSCPLARAVWVVKLTVTDLPVAAGTRSATAMVNATAMTCPPIAGVLATPARSVVVPTKKL